MDLTLEERKVVACFVGDEQFRAALMQRPEPTLTEWKFNLQDIRPEFIERLNTIDQDAAVAAVKAAYSRGESNGC